MRPLMKLPPALKRMETGLSSDATPVPPCFRLALSALMVGSAMLAAAPVAAQDDSGAAAPAAAAPARAPQQPRVNLMVTVPREEPSQADLRECRDDEEAAAISGEIVVCRLRGNDGTGLTGTRAESRKRYAQETMLKGAPRAPEAFGIPDHGNSIGIGGVPPPAYVVDFGVLPQAPAGSDADRIARGLPPLDQERELSEEEEMARREAAGIKTTVPPRPRKKG